MVDQAFFFKAFEAFWRFVAVAEELPVSYQGPLAYGPAKQYKSCHAVSIHHAFVQAKTSAYVADYYTQRTPETILLLLKVPCPFPAKLENY